MSREISRRNFLKLSGAIIADTAVVLGGAAGSYKYLHNEDMTRPPAEKESKRLVDLHAHPSKNIELAVLLEVLSRGCTCLAARNGVKDILTYEKFLKIKHPDARIEEINPGRFARLDYHDRTGFVMKGQEIKSEHHLVAAAFHGDYFPDYKSTDDAINRTHDYGGLSNLAHIASIERLHLFRPITIFGIINDEEREKVIDLLPKVHVAEEFNSFNINILPYIADFTRANDLAEYLIRNNHPLKKGVYVSDAHFLPEPIQQVGSYVDEKHFLSDRGLDDVLDAIKRGEFENSDKRYTSRLLVGRGIFGNV